MSKPKTYDFSGWATKNDIRCTDGRTIRKDAFKDDNGRKVPLVWMHDHKDPSNVLGHAYLENVDEGVIAYGVFNDTFAGKQVRELVKHGDVWSLSIWANNLTQNGGDVMHGSIKEVSVVLAPANPGAVIVDFPILAHGEEATDQVVIQIGEWLELGPNLQHAEEERDEPKDDPEQKPAEDAKEEPEKKPEEASPEEAEPDGSNEGETLNHGDEETVQDILDSMDEKQRNVCNYLVDLARNGENPEDQLEHASDEKDDGSEEDDDGETIGDIIETMNEKQKNVCKFLINEAFKAKEAEEGEEEPEKKAVEDEKSDEVKHSDEEREEEKTMNVFEQYGKNAPKNENALSHSADGNAIIKMAKENGGMSLRAAIGMYAKNNNKEIMHADESLQHANDDLGFQDIDQLFPDYQLTNGPEPEALTHDTSWVAQVMRKVSKSPKSRLRVRFADKRDITGRRAQGYTKGQQKQFMGNIKLLGRTVDPTTVYNLDHLNRDDEVDITDFNIVNYMYRDQRANLEEELARAILIGDGRNGSPEDDGEEIDKTKIIPIWEDDELFAIHKVVDAAGAVEVHFFQTVAVTQQVHVRIRKSRQHGLALQIDEFGLFRLQRQDLFSRFHSVYLAVIKDRIHKVTPSFCLFEDLHPACLAVDAEIVPVPDDAAGVTPFRKIRRAGQLRHEDRSAALGIHLCEHEPDGADAVSAAVVEIIRPGDGTPRTGHHEDLVRDAFAFMDVTLLDDLAGAGVQTVPAQDAVRADQRVSFHGGTLRAPALQYRSLTHGASPPTSR